jgi:hypothetical protein
MWFAYLSDICKGLIYDFSKIFELLYLITD